MQCVVDFTFLFFVKVSIFIPFLDSVYEWRERGVKGVCLFACIFIFWIPYTVGQYFKNVLFTVLLLGRVESYKFSGASATLKMTT